MLNVERRRVEYCLFHAADECTLLRFQVKCDENHASDKQGFTALMRELKAAFKPFGYLLTAAVSPNKKVIDMGKHRSCREV